MAVQSATPEYLPIMNALLGERWEQRNSVVLCLHFRTEDINLGELSRFLRLIDRLYGRLRHEDLRTYARHYDSQLEIAAIRTGTWETVFKDPISQAGKIYVVIYATVLVLTTGAVGFEAYQSGLLHREQRLEIRDRRAEMERRRAEHIRGAESALDANEEFRRLPKASKSKLATDIGSLLSNEERLLPSARRLAERTFAGIEIRVE